MLKNGNLKWILLILATAIITQVGNSIWNWFETRAKLPNENSKTIEIQKVKTESNTNSISALQSLHEQDAKIYKQVLRNDSLIFIVMGNQQQTIDNHDEAIRVLQKSNGNLTFN